MVVPRALLLPLAVGAALAQAGCARSPAAVQGRQAHQTIVSLNPCSDAILAEVADRNQLLAISRYSHDPAASSMDLAAARSWPAVSGSVEEIAALHPDVVVGSAFLPPASRAALARLGIRLETLGIAASVGESEAQVRALAALAGHPARGAALVARIEQALAAARPPSRPAPPADAIVWQAGGIVAGHRTLIADLLERTGFADAAAARGLGQAQALPLEAMLAAPPRVILTTGADRRLAHPVLRRLAGTARAAIEPALLWCGGPTIPRTAARLAQIRRGL